MLAGWRPFSRRDSVFRFAAFVGTSIPPFILGLLLLSIFTLACAGFRQDAPAFLADAQYVHFQAVHWFLTLDGVLNGRFDVTLNAFRHLILPVFTLSLFHWATLGRITRTLIIEEKTKITSC